MESQLYGFNTTKIDFVTLFCFSEFVYSSLCFDIHKNFS